MAKVEIRMRKSGKVCKVSAKYADILVRLKKAEVYAEPVKLELPVDTSTINVSEHAAKLAESHGIDPYLLYPGTGKDGSVTKRDVLAYINNE